MPSFRDLTGARRRLCLTVECAAIAGGLSVRGLAPGWSCRRSANSSPASRWMAAAPSAARTAGTLLRAVLFCGSIVTLALGVEVLVAKLMSASGF